ncbi:hypothetical protein [Planktothrix agardhii]|uniref:hypothetical protein n=1 Tax=Planktothrix agardhii TaxID=1160 RepID=UPI002B1F90F2|nr:hypothetical protein [Planktothrix agardhii]MEA5561421.1 hypothetical protein [Planktothrix agardhii UHCC 0887]
MALFIVLAMIPDPGFIELMYSTNPGVPTVRSSTVPDWDLVLVLALAFGSGVGFGVGIVSGSVTGSGVGVGSWPGNRFNCLTSPAANSVLRLAIATSLSKTSPLTFSISV